MPSGRLNEHLQPGDRKGEMQCYQVDCANICSAEAYACRTLLRETPLPPKGKDHAGANVANNL